MEHIKKRKNIRIVSFRERDLSYFLAHASFVYHIVALGHLLHSRDINHVLKIFFDVMIHSKYYKYYNRIKLQLK